MVGGIRALPSPRRTEPPYFTRTQIAAALDHVAVLLELKGANPFRVRAYQNAARTLGSQPIDLWSHCEDGTLESIKGIGKNLAAAIADVLECGDWGDWQDLHISTPHGLLEMLEIPGMGPKRVKILHEELDIDGLGVLRGACEAGDVAKLKGFGKVSEAKILLGIDLLSRYRARRRLNVGLAYGQAFKRLISQIEGVDRAQIAGSLRRRRETVGDLDIVAEVKTEHTAIVAEKITSLPGVIEVKGAGSSKVSVVLSANILTEGFNLGHLDANVNDAIGGEEYEELEATGTIDAQIRMVPSHQFAYTLAYFTGSKEHNIRMRQLAIELGLRLNEFGLIPETLAGDMKGEDAAVHSLHATSEEEIHRHLGLDWIPPELREDRGEIKAAQQGRLPNLVEEDDLKGAFHNHTLLSDGSADLEAMATAAMERGWTYLGISDHSVSLKVARGASVEALMLQGEQIAALNQSWEEQSIDFRLFHGAEVDIHADGQLDYEDEVLKGLDHVIASVHQPLSVWRDRDEGENTEILLDVLEHPAITMIGHPTGRILQGREGYPINSYEIIDKMAEKKRAGRAIAVELNASPYRLDTDWRELTHAKQQGVPVSVAPDAHSVEGLADVRYGIAVGRKAWLEAKDVLNAYTLAELDSFGLQPSIA